MQVEPTSIQEIIIPIDFKLKMNMKELINAPSLPRALSILADSTYFADLGRTLQRSFRDRKSLEMLEQIQQEYYLGSLTGIMAGVPFHLGILLSYFLYRLQEVENLRIILESKIKEIDLEFTRNLLIYYR
jgi:vacuolar-type H+-ATPase subunit C/Vma6